MAQQPATTNDFIIRESDRPGAGSSPPDARGGRGRWLRSYRGGILLFGGLLAVLIWQSRPEPLPAAWQTDYPSAVAQAKRDGKKLLIAFHMHGCPPCRAMAATVLGAEPVTAALQAAYVPVKLDVFANRELAKTYEVTGTPAYMVVDAESGELLTSAYGYLPVDIFVQFLERGADLTRPGHVARLRPTVP